VIRFVIMEVMFKPNVTVGFKVHSVNPDKIKEAKTSCFIRYFKVNSSYTGSETSLRFGVFITDVCVNPARAQPHT